MASTATKRIWYAPYACMKSGAFPTVVILGDSERVCPPTVEAWQVFDQVLNLSGFTASSIGYYNCRVITGGSKLSLHAYGLAGDFDPFALGNGYYSGWSKFSWSRTTFTPEQVAYIEKIRTNNGKKVFRWGGWWTYGRDYMHWEIDCSPSDLKTGIDYSTVLGGKQGDGMALKKGDKGNAVTKFQKAILAWDKDALPEWGADGDFGSETEAWVKKYQQSAGLTQTGQIDGVTAALLLEYMPDFAGGGGITQAQGDQRWVRRGINQTIKFG